MLCRKSLKGQRNATRACTMFQNAFQETMAHLSGQKNATKLPIWPQNHIRTKTPCHSTSDSCFEDSDPVNPIIQIDSSWFSPGEKAKKVGMIKFRSRFMPMAWWPWLPRGQLMGREGVPSKWWSVPTCCRSALCSHYTL